MNSKEDIKTFLNKNHFIPSKKMGQNFLYSLQYQQKIVNAANISNNDNIIEIGPGLGALTKHLILKCHELVAVELDKRLYDFLNQNVKAKNFSLINNDVLHIDFDQLINEMNWNQTKIVANLPYSISSKIILKIIQCKKIDESYLLVQKEMAERICAKVNTKDYNALTVLVSLFSEAKILFTISPIFFIPKPQVDSVLLKIKYDNKYNLDFKKIESFLKICFQHKRKTILNNLSSKYDKKLIKEKLAATNIGSNIRSESLTTDELVKIYERFNCN